MISRLSRWFCGQLRVEAHHVGETEDGIHRGAQFVAHIGEEDTLGAVGGFGSLLGRGKLIRALGDEFLQVLLDAQQFARTLIELLGKVIEFIGGAERRAPLLLAAVRRSDTLAQ